jgi:cleavage and polyadenylation specificity factor subunit 3
LAAEPPKANELISGLLVAKDYSYTLLDPADLRDFAGLSTCVVTQRQSVTMNIGWDLLRWHLEGMFGVVEDGIDDANVPTLRVSLCQPSQCAFFDWIQVMSAVDIKHVQGHEVILEWTSGASNDMIADSTLALITSADVSPASVKRESGS